MRSAMLILTVIAFTAPQVRAVDEVEELLILKFNAQNKAEVDRLRAYVNETVVRAKDMREGDPERGIDLLREASNRVDAIKLLPPGERRAILEIIQPIMSELRDVVLLKRREQASRRIDAFANYLQVVALESRYPGRSGVEQWEPANFWGPDGQSRPAKLVRILSNAITRKTGQREESLAPAGVPIIQVFGGMYVYDRQTGYHLYLSNREFYEQIWSRLLREFIAGDGVAKTRSIHDAVRPVDARRLQRTIDTGEYFLRGYGNPEPLPGIGSEEAPFLAFLMQTLMDRTVLQYDQIYTFPMQERLQGFSRIQMSATKRTLHLLQLKDVAVSPIYAEILREETNKILRSEYTNFIESEVNRAIQYIFSKLK